MFTGCSMDGMAPGFLDRGVVCVTGERIVMIGSGVR